MAATTGDYALDPTQLVHQFLAAQGLQPTAENVRRALTANAANPGYIPGLVNQEPPPPDATPTQVSGGGNKPATTNGQPNKTAEMPTPPVPPRSADGGDATTQPNTSITTPPAQTMTPADMIINGLAAGAGASAIGMDWLRNTPDTGTYMGNAGVPPRGPVDVPATGITVDSNPRIGNTRRLGYDGGSGAGTGSLPQLSPPPQAIEAPRANPQQQMQDVITRMLGQDTAPMPATPGAATVPPAAVDPYAAWDAEVQKMLKTDPTFSAEVKGAGKGVAKNLKPTEKLQFNKAMAKFLKGVAR